MKVTVGEWSKDVEAGEICLLSKRALVSIMLGGTRPGIHIGVRPMRHHAYVCDLRGNMDEERLVQGRWIWGRAVACYDFCLEYFGLGPLFLVCWIPK